MWEMGWKMRVGSGVAACLRRMPTACTNQASPVHMHVDVHVVFDLRALVTQPYISMMVNCTITATGIYSHPHPAHPALIQSRSPPKSSAPTLNLEPPNPLKHRPHLPPATPQAMQLSQLVCATWWVSWAGCRTRWGAATSPPSRLTTLTACRACSPCGRPSTWCVTDDRDERLLARF